MKRAVFLGLSAVDWREIYDAENPLACFWRKAFAEDAFNREEAESCESAAPSPASRWIAKMFEPFG